MHCHDAPQYDGLSGRRIVWAWTIEAFGSGCLGVNVISVCLGVGDFSALSWESVDGCHVHVDDK